MYQVYAAVQGAKIKTIPLLLNQKFALDLEAFKKKVSPVSKLTFLCSPSNPTGNTFDESTTFEICKTLEGSGLLVFDGAYTEFSSVNYTSELLNEFSNVVVLRTLSKAFALAGSRCGVLLASKEICDYIMRVIPPYSFSVPAEQTVLKGLSKQGIKSSKQNVEKIINERAYLTGKLSELNCVKEVFPSEANFILIKVEDAEVFYNKAKDSGLLVRNVSYQPSLDNCIRVSIGTREQNQQLLEAVQ
jgi:histidinol-phosphate aminotransferase